MGDQKNLRREKGKEEDKWKEEREAQTIIVLSDS